MENYRPRLSPKMRVVCVSICLVCALCATLAPLLVGCAASQVRTLFGLGAVLKLVCYEGMGEWYDFANALLVETQAMVDAETKTSDLARFNAASVGEDVVVGREVYEMVQIATQAYDLTQGGYDPTAYWLVDLWGFSPAKQNEWEQTGGIEPPSYEKVAAMRSLCDLSAVECRQEGDVYILSKTKSVECDGKIYATALDLGGIAKGYVVDKLADFAKQNGITKGYVSFGSSSVALFANKQGKTWDLSLRHPRGDEGRTFCTTPVQNRMVATSGDYENYYIRAGKRYCHLIDPSTGSPIDNGVHSVTVLGQNAALCDALATGLAVKGIDFIGAFAASDACRSLGLDVVAVYGEEDALQCYSTLAEMETKL